MGKGIGKTLRGAVAGSAIAFTCVSLPASAGAQEGGQPECAPVLRALQALGAAPRYHWTMSATTPARRRPVEREEIVLDDVVYLTPDEGRWMKQRIPLSEREARMANELAHNPPTDCKSDGTETKDGVATEVYTYRQAGPTQGTGDDDKDRVKRIWIGTADGLPRFFKSSEGPVSVAMRVEYADVVSPLP